MRCSAAVPRPATKPRSRRAGADCRTARSRSSSSDHAPYRYDETGKLPKGEKTTFKDMANGVPGLELRLPLLFTFGYGAGKLTLQQFVALTATRHAQIYGCYPAKGTIAVGSDADIAIWDPELRVEVNAELVHDNTGYTRTPAAR